MKVVTEKIHRLLAPRLIVLIGTTSSDGRKNIIPINNITSISTEPGMCLIAVYHLWITAKNLKQVDGFTISIPTQRQLELVWKLAPKFSGYESKLDKIDEFKDEIDLNFSRFGPVLKNSLGWIECRTIDRIESEANHVLVVGKYTKALYEESKFTDDLMPINNPKPIMQWTRNYFSASSDVIEIPYFGGPHR